MAHQSLNWPLFLMLDCSLGLGGFSRKIYTGWNMLKSWEIYFPDFSISTLPNYAKQSMNLHCTWNLHHTVSHVPLHCCLQCFCLLRHWFLSSNNKSLYQFLDYLKSLLEFLIMLVEFFSPLRPICILKRMNVILEVFVTTYWTIHLVECSNEHQLIYNSKEPGFFSILL